MSRLKILAVVGTRPEAVKMAPVVRRLAREKSLCVRVCAAGQHRELLDGALRCLSLRPDVALHLMKQGQTPAAFLGRLLGALDGVLDAERPGLVLAEGDTTTVLGAALAAFHRKVPFGHVEAGLRSFDPGNPFPEEQNRVVADALSDLLFAPTPRARRNLLEEGVAPGKILVTGNTSVDSLFWALGRRRRFRSPALRGLAPEAPLVAVTLHRRESFGAPMERIFRGLLAAAERLPELLWVYPVHPNPSVRAAARRLRHPRVLLCEPLDYLDFVLLLERCLFVVTDSGGVQEEAVSLGRPVLVTREKTERPEALDASGVLVGASADRLVREAVRLSALPRIPARPRRGPFGDGRAADRIARRVLAWAAAQPAVSL